MRQTDTKIFLADRMDNSTNNPKNYTAVTVPLLMSLVTLVCLSFGSKGGNHWWFGIRKDFCQFVLGVCPFLQEYGNISYSIQNNETESEESSVDTSEKLKTSTSEKDLVDEQPRAVVPVLSIEMPD